MGNSVYVLMKKELKAVRIGTLISFIIKQPKLPKPPNLPELPKLPKLTELPKQSHDQKFFTNSSCYCDLN